MTPLGMRLRNLTAWMAFWYAATGHIVVATTTIRPENPSPVSCSAPIFPANFLADNETPTNWQFPFCPATKKETAVSPSLQRMLKIALGSYGPTIYGFACASLPLNVALIFFLGQNMRRVNHGRVEVIFLTFTDILVALGVISCHWLQHAFQYIWPLDDCRFQVFIAGNALVSIGIYANRVATLQMGKDLLHYICDAHGAHHLMSTRRLAARLLRIISAFCAVLLTLSQGIPEILALVGMIDSETTFVAVLTLIVLFFGGVSVAIAVMTYLIWKKIQRLNFQEQEGGKEEGAEAAQEEPREEKVIVGLNGRIKRVESSDGRGYKVIFSKGIAGGSAGEGRRSREDGAGEKRAMDVTKSPPAWVRYRIINNCITILLINIRTLICAHISRNLITGY